MAAFSYQHHHPFPPLDAAYLLSPPAFDLPLVPALPPPPPPQQPADLSITPSWFPFYYGLAPVETPAAVVSAGSSGAAASTQNAAAAAAAAESSSSLSSGGTTLPSGDNRFASSSSSSAQVSEVASRTPSPMEKKRKERQRSSPVAAQSKDAEDTQRRKQKKRGGPVKKAGEKTTLQEPPTGYIHVRARRGQATDSHSLAERARREKISERMKMLQGLVPGCDKVVGKALMLDEIINYVQSLQNQVEFLSMKLASANPMLYDSCFEIDYMTAPEKLEGMSPALLPVQQVSHVQPTAFVETTNSYPVQDTTVSFLLDGHGPSGFPQDNSNSFVMQLGENRKMFLNQVEPNNMCSFQ